MISSSLRPPERQAFTLIELMGVIASIAVLIGLLLPASAGRLGHAGLSSCV